MTVSPTATAKGIQLGWYGNNCPETNGVGRGPKYCSEHGKLEADWSHALSGDVAALIGIGETVILLRPPLFLVGLSIRMERGCQ